MGTALPSILSLPDTLKDWRFCSCFLGWLFSWGHWKNDMQLDQKALAEKYYTELDIDDMEIDVRLATPWLGTLPLVPRDMKIR